MIEPLRYITSKKEYQGLVDAEDVKEALDEFWLDNASNPDRARELIKHFYNRVEYANIYFSSFDEGGERIEACAILFLVLPT